MWQVTIFGAYILLKQEHAFNSLEEANIFLVNKDFVFDSNEDDIHYWNLDENTFALIEKC